MKNVLILGSSGSIGTQTLDVCNKHSDKLNVWGLVVWSNSNLLKQQIELHGVNPNNCIVCKDYDCKQDEQYDGKSARCTESTKRIIELIESDEVDVVVNAMSGAAGLQTSYATLRANKQLALANKESLVVGGELIIPLAKQKSKELEKKLLLPIDSEHGAIFQCLVGENLKEVNCLWVTASGGPFRGKSQCELLNISTKQALAHPTWNMGPKITIDSSTLMNKGLEVIEAHHLFDMPYSKIKVVVQPQSAIHSMVEFLDGSVKAHLGTTDMRIPIQYSLSYPDRWESPVKPMDFARIGSLDFLEADMDTFKCLKMAYYAGKKGRVLPCIMNAANEVAVELFLSHQCQFLDIGKTIEKTIDNSLNDGIGYEPVESLDQLVQVDQWGRTKARQILNQK